MSYMEEVAKMLGIEMDKDFKCYGYDGVFCITEKQLTYNGVWAADALMMLLNGSLTVVKTPWKPKHDEIYYCVNSTGRVCEEKWYGDVIDTLYYKLGNCYKCKSQAEANVDRWLSFYRSDDVLEV